MNDVDGDGLGWYCMLLGARPASKERSDSAPRRSPQKITKVQHHPILAIKETESEGVPEFGQKRPRHTKTLQNQPQVINQIAATGELQRVVKSSHPSLEHENI